MSARSRYLKAREPISRPRQKFEAWLMHQQYDVCAEMYPAALLAATLVNEYFQEYPEREHERESVEEHAEEIGWISDYDPDSEEDYQE